MRPAILSLAFALVSASVAAASEEVAVRVGAHPGFGRVVFEWPAIVNYTILREQGGFRVVFDREGQFATGTLPRSLPAPILALRAEGAEAVIAVAEGATARHYRLDRRIVIDVSRGGGGEVGPAVAAQQTAATLPLPPPWPDPAGADATSAANDAGRPDGQPATAAGSAAPAVRAMAEDRPSETAAREPSAVRSPTSEGRHDAAEAAGGASQTAEAATRAGEVGTAASNRAEGATQPVSLLVRTTNDRNANGILLPFAAETGFAVFRRGGALWLVADEARPLDMRRLRGHPVFGEAEVTVTATGTLLRLPNLAGSGLRVERRPEGVAVRPTPPGEAVATVRQEVVRETGRTELRLGVSGANRVVRLTDPETGERLLVGTVTGDGAGVGVGRSGAEFSLLPSDRGVVVLAWSENVQLTATPNGFRIQASSHVPDGLALSGLADAPDFALTSRTPTRSFDLPALPADALAERLRLLRAEVARAAPLARSRPRLLLAETMLAAGLGAEAHALLLLAAAEDPLLAVSPHWKALAGAAGLLASRLDEARPLLLDATIPETDEILLWRAWLAREDGAPAAHTAPRFAAAAPLLLTYPRELARRVVPPAVETMLEGGERPVAEALLRRLEDWPELTLARGMVHEQRGEVDQALAEYARTATLRDRWQRARGILRATELALREGRLGLPEAAARLEPLLYAWRGDAWERNLRLRAAELRAEAGDWPGAIALLRETAALFPETAERTRALLVDLFGRLFRDGAAENLPPSQAITLFEENVDLLPAGADGDRIVARFAERLVALELTSRASALLARLIEGQPERSEDRAWTGLRLARLRLEDGDAAGALAALAASEPARPTTALAEERALLRARALAATGATAEARELLRTLPQTAAREVAADLAFASGEWAEATTILATLLREIVPVPSQLGPAQRQLVLRAAVAATLADDRTSLGWLHDTFGAAMAEGAFSEPFRLLSADGQRPSGQMRQLAAELQLARSMQRSLGRPVGTSRD